MSRACAHKGVLKKMKKLIFSFVIFAIVLVSCPHAKDSPSTPAKKPLPPADPTVKGTTWEDADQQTISFSDSVALAMIQGHGGRAGLKIEAPYEVKDGKVIIKLDDFISKLENFDEKVFAEAFKTMVVDTMIAELEEAEADPSASAEEKTQIRAKIKKLESGLGWLTNKAGIKKYMIEILIPLVIEDLEKFIADPDVPEDKKEEAKRDLAKMKASLANPVMLDIMIEAQYIKLKVAINGALPDIKKANPITLKCEEGKTLETTGKLISSAFIVNLEFVAPIDIKENDEFMKK